MENQLVRFGASLWGTHSYWSKSQQELARMIHRLGTMTLFFTLRSTNTKWSNLHKVIEPNTQFHSPYSWAHFIEKIVQNLHIIAFYMHLRFTIFNEEVIERLFHTKDYWYRYEWKHHGSTHVNCLLWLPNAQKMDILDWSNPHEL